MALIGSMTKQPREILPIDIPFTAVIAGRTVTSIICTVEVPVGMVKESQEVVGETLQIYFSGGTTGVSYRWTVLTEITIGGRLTKIEDEFDIVVEEV